MTALFLLYISEGFLWEETEGKKEERRYLYVSLDVSQNPGATRLHGNNEASSHASQIPATRAFLRKLDGLPFGLEPVFVRSALFCRRSDFGRARLRMCSVSMSNAMQCRTLSVIADQPARQSSRTRYAVRLRCVRVDRPPALNADYSGSNGSGRSAATVSAYHQVWASMGTIGSKGWFSMTAAWYNTDVRWILLDIPWTLKRVPNSHSSGYLLPIFVTVWNYILYMNCYTYNVKLIIIFCLGEKDVFRIYFIIFYYPWFLNLFL